MSEGAEEVGALATAALVAREIDRAKHDAPAVGHAADEPCANCGAVRVGPYCHACGQAGHVHRNLMALVHDLAHGVFHFEGKVWHTLPLLAWRPGELTRRYVAGERARFVSPMALFLFSVFLLFAVVANLGHRGGEHEARRQAGELTRMRAEREKATTRLATLRTVRATLPEAGGGRARMDAQIAGAEQTLRALDVSSRIVSVAGEGSKDARFDGDRADVEQHGFDTGVGFLDATVAHMARNPDLTLYKLKSYAYKYSWALIPISLPFLWLLFAFRRDVGIYDHAIFAIYSLSFMSLATVLLAVLAAIGIPAGFLVLAALIVPPVHMYRQLKGAYHLGWLGATWRTAALLLITAVTSALFLSFLIWMGSE